MNISLRNFSQNDLELLSKWDSDINAQQYMSRCEPEVYAQTNIMQSYLSAWYVILMDEQPIGTIWFEKETIDDDFVILGILLGNATHFGKGIGRKAIELGLQRAANRLEFSKVRLHVRKSNKRAINCYIKCGFEITGEDTKEMDEGEVIPFIEMEYQRK
ncbi:MAG: GNAT family N-acetyltransferase [Anaerolineaceae bacterium]|nr:GNAT family N-acetyltransferase [Anaerolineaceae bacterium]